MFKPIAMPTDPQVAFERLARRFSLFGWTLVSQTSQVLAMARRPGVNVEHELYVHEPWGRLSAEGSVDLVLNCTVNVHFPTLEALINQALERDPREAGRQSLRLSLARLAPPENLTDGVGYSVAGRGESAESSANGTDLLCADFDAHLEPILQRLVGLDILALEAEPPAAVDPWTWQLRRAAYLHLHGDPANAQRYLAWLQVQAEQQRAEASRLAASNDAVDSGSQREAVQRRRWANDALNLVSALNRPRRRVIPLYPRK